MAAPGSPRSSRLIRVLEATLAAALVSGAALACSSSPTIPEARALVGRWEWVRATGGIAGVELTPESEGYTVELRFSATGTVEHLRNGAVQLRTSYRVLPATDSGEHPRVVYDAPVLGAEEQSIVEVGNGRLILLDPCCDRYRWEFRTAG